MAPFKPTIVSLDYDFTEIPKVGGDPGEKCAGKGTIPEPTDEQVDAFLATSDKLRPKGKNADGPNFAQIRAAWTDALVELGLPKAHLDELPLTAFHSFKDHVAEELLPNGGRSVSEV